jgi:hypothetical protein
MDRDARRWGDVETFAGPGSAPWRWMLRQMGIPIDRQGPEDGLLLKHFAADLAGHREKGWPEGQVAAALIADNPAAHLLLYRVKGGEVIGSMVDGRAAVIRRRPGG